MLSALSSGFGTLALLLSLVGPLHVELATKTVASSFGAFHVVSSLKFAIRFGWIILAIGTHLSGTLGPIRSISLAFMSALMMGVLKGGSLTSVVATAGLCIALVPLGVGLLRA